MAAILQGGKRDLTSQDLAFVITNYTQDVAMDCNAAVVAETNDVLATLIKILIQKGIVNGTVA